jgi:hypothetical protein
VSNTDLDRFLTIVNSDLTEPLVFCSKVAVFPREGNHNGYD